MTSPVNSPCQRKAVYLTRTRAVPDRVMDVVCSGVKMVLDIARSDLEIKDLRSWGMGTDGTAEYRSLDWYQSQAKIVLDHGFGQQVDARKILYLARYEPWQEGKPHMEAMVVDQDLNHWGYDGQYINYLFAAAERNFGFVLSLARLGKLPEQHFLPIMRKFAAHEFGHVLGLVDRNYNYIDEIGRHCGGEKGPCLMKQSLSLEILLKQHLEEQKAGQEICPDCVSELRSNSTAVPSPL